MTCPSVEDILDFKALDELSGADGPMARYRDLNLVLAADPDHVLPSFSFPRAMLGISHGELGFPPCPTPTHVRLRRRYCRERCATWQLSLNRHRTVSFGLSGFKLA
jgi:hypothetical protein